MESRSHSFHLIKRMTKEIVIFYCCWEGNGGKKSFRNIRNSNNVKMGAKIEIFISFS